MVILVFKLRFGCLFVHFWPPPPVVPPRSYLMLTEASQAEFPSTDSPIDVPRPKNIKMPNQGKSRQNRNLPWSFKTTKQAKHRKNINGDEEFVKPLFPLFDFTKINSIETKGAFDNSELDSANKYQETRTQLQTTLVKIVHKGIIFTTFSVANQVHDHGRNLSNFLRMLPDTNKKILSTLSNSKSTKGIYILIFQSKQIKQSPTLKMNSQVTVKNHLNNHFICRKCKLQCLMSQQKVINIFATK